MLAIFQRLQFFKPRLVTLGIVLLLTAASASAQSTDVGFPTPITSDEISGRITPRDVGDARFTRHFYTFKGREGDLVVTVESTNLDGAVDVFTASSLRPITKVTLYGGASATQSSKSVYLRGDESFVLRVEGRSGGDADGTYRVRFDGAFVAFAAATEAKAAEGNAATVTQPKVTESSAGSMADSPIVRNRGTRRATATGARIPETAEERVERLAAEARERATVEARIEARERARTEARERREQQARERRDERNRIAREERTRRDAAKLKAEADRAALVRRESTKESETAVTVTPRTPTADNSADSSTAGTAPTPGATNRSRAARSSGTRASSSTPTPSPRRSARARRGAATPGAAAATTRPESASSPPSLAPPPVSSPRLIIETKSGAKSEREMSTVRRVTIENNMVVVVLKDGKVERQPLLNITRMSIEP
ncbi:MAG: hypothetical protein M3458_08990 [Acidobacteriota bacterium]|nr:hypothetical protein [Acidobacteriota bacterium]